MAVDPARWLLFSYSVPKDPSTVRVNLWRRLRDLGVMYVGQSVALMPDSPSALQALDACRTTAIEAGGTARLLPIAIPESDAQETLVADFRAVRGAEYHELQERAEAMMTELTRESEGGKFIFAELEENEDELEKLERWFTRISARDAFGSPDREQSAALLGRCREAFALFRQATVSREMEFGEDPSQPRQQSGPAGGR